MYELRQYQQDNFNQLRQSYAKGNKRVLYQAATGSGKTVVASMVCKLSVEKGNRVMPVAHRRELIHQFADKLDGIGLHCAKIMAGERLNIGADIQVGSIQTLWARFLKEKRIALHAPDLIIIDEAHRSLSPTYLKLLEAFPDAWLLGLTATPVRTDGRGLGHIYEDMVQSPSVAELTEMGFLVPVIPYGGSTGDLKGIKSTAGDYNKKELEERMNLPNLVGDCVQNYLKHALDRPTMVFASGVKHSIALAEAYNAVGIKAEHVDANTEKWDRDHVLGKLASGEIDVITNCMVYTEGTDCPPISCIQIANPSKSIAKYLQQIGRGMRPDPDNPEKKDCIVLDHSGATVQHGFVEEPIPWSLDTKGKLATRIAERSEKQLKQFECIDCGHIWEGKIRCPRCGRQLELSGEMAEYTEAELIQLKRKEPKDKPATMEEKRRFYSELLGYAQGMGRDTGKTYSQGWAAHKYRAKFGVWPNGLSNTPMHPSKLTKAFIQSQNIRYAKRMNK